MFDITSSKLLILAIVALIVVGPKDLPILLRTIGKYLGVIRRQAAEFRSQFDEAMREAELDHLKKEFEDVSREMRATMNAGTRALDRHIEAADKPAEPPRFGTGMPATPPEAASETQAALPASTPEPNVTEKTPGEAPNRGAA
jgi:sec-independent protein translocase protein TatB